ncbi:hypothetical protein C0584_00035 [Candidatus Parcubacteria bacterium]|mgnify:CR=1 FL=1|nr:MAG: hypothetical protein C0584_00035 [Candidatus Parcubacteria bacterium]
MRCIYSGNFESYKAFKRFQKKIRAATLGTGTAFFIAVFAFLSGWLTSTVHPQSLAATFGWVQTDWSGETAIESAQHSIEASLAENLKWDKYASQSNLDATSVAGQITLAGNATTWDFDTGATLDTWATSSEVQVLGATLSLLKKDGDRCANTTVCDGSACSNDWSTDNNICHNDNTKCVYDSGASVLEYADGYELCNSDSWYKSCTGGVWGTQVNSPSPSGTICNFEGNGDSTGIYPPATCASGISGGFSGSCQSCNYFLADTGSACKVTCSSNIDCWDSAQCFGATCVPACSASTPCGTECGFDGRVYGTFQSGGECWMDRNIGANTVTQAGTLMQWASAISACPSGFRLPTDTEWSNSGAGITLRSHSYKACSGQTYSQLSRTYHWSSTSFDTNYAWAYDYTKTVTKVQKCIYESARCIKN